MTDVIIAALITGATSSGICSLIVFLIQRHDKKTDKRQEEYNELSQKISIIADAVRGLEHDRITYLGGKYINRGGITKDEYENLHDSLYIPYKALGGNGTAEKFMHDCEKLPIITKSEAYERDLNV